MMSLPLPACERLGARALVDGFLFRAGTRVRVSVEVVDAQSDMTVLANAYESAPDSLQELAARVARDVAPHVGARRDEPEGGRSQITKAGWKPTILITAYLLLVVTTIVLVAVKRTPWPSLIGVAVLPPYFIWVLLDAHRSSVARAQNEVRHAAARDTKAQALTLPETQQTVEPRIPGLEREVTGATHENQPSPAAEKRTLLISGDWLSQLWKDKPVRVFADTNAAIRTTTPSRASSACSPGPTSGWPRGPTSSPPRGNSSGRGRP